MLNRKVILLTLLLLVMVSHVAISFADGVILPTIDVSVDAAESNTEVASSIQILLLLTVLTIAPSILLMMTSFTRIIIVLSFVRRALSLQTTPPNQVIIGLALFLTLFVMSPVFSEIYEEAYVPLIEGELNQEEAIDRGVTPLKEFMLRQVRSKDMALFLKISETDMPADAMDLPLTVVIPSFIVSELKTAFEIGFLIFIPFIVIDMLVASTLMALGMMMLPPVMISLPFKILLFILVDGWNLVIEKIILSIR